MNILFIIPPPSFPSRLERVRSLGLIKELSRNHRIFLLALVTNVVKEEDLAEIKKYGSGIHIVTKSLLKSLAHCVSFLFSSLPLEVAYCRSSEMEEKVKAYVLKYKIDLIYIKRLRAAQFVENASVPVILDTTDAMSLFYSRAARAVTWHKKPLYYEEALKYRWYEKKMVRKFKNWVVSSSVDADYLRAMAPSDTIIYVVPNGVDTEYFSPSREMTGKHVILFSGLMDKFVNIEAAEYFVKEIFPYILEVVPDAKFCIVGPNPARKIRKLAGTQIEVVGFTPDLRTYIAKAEVVVCPVKTGAGTRNKILQAWAMRKPVVSTLQGIEGLEYENGKSALVADSSQDFANAVVNIFQDEGLKKRLSENGYTLVREKYAMEQVAEDLHSIIEAVSKHHTHAA